MIPGPRHVAAPAARERWRISALLACVAIIGTYYVLFSRFFPGRYGRLGHDYDMFLPTLLDGYYWFHVNGAFTPPWFTPSFCGGVPKLPNPQALYYSVPQLLTIVTDPLSSVRITLLLFAVVGFGGTYLFVRRIVAATRPTAFLAATLFLFNGLYAHRMAIGHLTFHSFMLIPLLAYHMLRGPHAPLRHSRAISPFDVGIGAMLLTYVAATGLVHVLFQALTILLLIAVICGLFGRSAFHPGHAAATFLLASFVACLACSAQLVAVLAYLRNFPRAMYLLPGIPRIWDLLRIVCTSIFFHPADEAAMAAMTNFQWVLERHEFEFGLTPVPLFILTAAVVLNLHRLASLRFWLGLRGDQWLYLAIGSLLMALPLALNYYTPEWNAALRRIPIFGSSVTLFRWLSVYIPIIVLLVAIAIEETPLLRRHAGLIAVVGVTVILGLNILTDREYYHRQDFDPARTLEAYRAVRTDTWQPAITRIGGGIDDRGRSLAGGNDLLSRGSSALPCYESIFGYRLEALPVKTLHPGPVMEESSGRLNIKNPVCYVWPRENDCAPGDHFDVRQGDAAEAFTHFRPYAFRAPLWQRAANWGSMLGLTTMGVLIAVSAAASIRRRVARHP